MISTEDVESARGDALAIIMRNSWGAFGKLSEEDILVLEAGDLNNGPEEIEPASKVVEGGTPLASGSRKHSKAKRHGHPVEASTLMTLRSSVTPRDCSSILPICLSS